MNRWGLAARGLRHSWRRQVGLLLGTLVTAAVLVGALGVGDSVRASLRRLALQRIGQVDAVMVAGDRLFGASLAGRWGSPPGAERVAAALRRPGVAATADGKHRARDVQVLGIDGRFREFAPGSVPARELTAGQALVNGRLARQLDVEVGDEFLVRVEKPTALPRESALGDEEDVVAALRVEVVAVLDADQFGNFGLEAHQIPPFNCFVDREWLAGELEVAGRANLLVVAGEAPPDQVTETAAAHLREVRELDDLELELTSGEDRTELRSRRVFLDAPVEEVVRGMDQPAVGALTYFVNEIRSADRSTPYSTVTALGLLAGAPAPGSGLDLSAVCPPGLAEDEIVVNEWLAEDLEVAAGDEVELAYFALGADLRLEERRRTFRVHGVVPLEGLAADPTWMPDFPGLKDSENCRDWEPGIPIDLPRIRDRDEEYWDLHRGTPKAFVSLAAGQEMWGSRFGSLTAVRLAGDAAGDLVAALDQHLDPASLGLFFVDQRTQALDASQTATDFGGLFVGLSFFLIVAALLLTVLMFVFGVEQRAAEVGTLLALGFRPRQVRGLLLREAGLVAVVGTALGVGVGLLYTRAVLHGLATLWSDAVASAPLEFHAGPVSLLGGTAGSLVMALAALAWTLRKQARRPAAELLAGGGEPPVAGTLRRPRRMRASFAVAALGLVTAVGLLMSGDPGGGPAAAALFFGAGAVLLVAGLAASRVLLFLPRRDLAVHPSLSRLGLSNCVRRPGRSLATVGLLASGTFLVVSIGVHFLGPPRDVSRRDSGTGGFGLVGTSSLGVFQDLNSAEGRDAFGLTEAEMADVAVVPLRRSEGDEASCLNLSLSRNPRLYGIDPGELTRRGAFGDDAPWDLLADDGLGDGPIPAIGDAASVTWALHKKVGDTLEYRDERGHPFEVQIVGTVSNSILQGMLLIDQRAFQAKFPSTGGFRFFLVDVPQDRAAGVSQALSLALEDWGLQVQPTADRLAEFQSVQNTYLAIFQTLGGLGVLLGTVGLALVVLRNVLERRGELALCRAVGYRRRSVRFLVLSEHGVLLALGLGCGTLAALVAILPGGRESLSPLPLLLLAGIALNGVLCVLLATAAATRGPLVDALREP